MSHDIDSYVSFDVQAVYLNGIRMEKECGLYHASMKSVVEHKIDVCIIGGGVFLKMNIF